MQARRSWRLALAGSFVVIAFAASQVGAAPRRMTESADRMHLEFEIELPPPVRTEVAIAGSPFTRLLFPGLRLTGSPGAPELYVDTEWLAVPPGGTATVRVLEQQVEDLGVLRLVPRPFAAAEAGPGIDGRAGTGPEMLREDLRYDPRAYLADGAQTEIVHLGAPATLRYQSVVRLEIRALLYDPQRERARVVRRVRVAVDFRPAPRIDADHLAIAPPASPAWERLYAGLVLNPAAGSEWRRAPQRTVQAGKPLASGLLRPGLLGEDEWKVHVTATGPVRVTGSALAAAGFPQGTLATALRLVIRRYDPAEPLAPAILEIPIQVDDTNHDGVFDATDSFVFYGEHPRDDSTSEDRVARASEENVYWLSVVPGGTPARMPVRARRPAAAAGPATFQQNITYEQDSTLNLQVFGNNNDPGDTEEMYFWTGVGARTSVTVALPGRAAGAAVHVCVETQEDSDTRAFQLFAKSGAADSVLLATNFGTSSTGSTPRQTTCGTMPDASLGASDLRAILRETFPRSGTPYLDLVRVDYPATYVAAGNRIRCTNGGGAGEQFLPIGGFTDSNLRAFDITDPKRTAAFDLAGAYAGGVLTLTDSIATGVVHSYLVVADASIPTAAVDLDRRDDILSELATTPLGTYDVLVVCADILINDPVLAEWKAFREAQGHRLRMVRVSDACDAFRGGLHHYEGVHRLCEQAFRNWGIEFVVLVGDGSEDAAHLLPESGPDLVPSRLRYFLVPSSSDPGNPQYRNDINDKWYSQVAGGPSDPISDLIVGRLPAANSTELAAVLRKTMLYETPAAGDDSAWRKRVLMFADDEWVKRAEPNIVHRRGCFEPLFEKGVIEASNVVDGAFPGDLRSVRFFLREHSDRMGANNDPHVPFVPEHRAVDPDSILDYCPNGQPHSVGSAETSFYGGMLDGQVGKALVDSVGAGCLFFALQSHASRNVVGDEAVINNVEPPFVPPFRNDGKPFIFFGFGCHLNEFGPAGENGGRIPGDCLGENLVLTESRGAVASYASTGFEFLQENNQYHTWMWRVIFEKRYSRAIGGASVAADTIAARWGLGELLELSEIGFGDPDLSARYCVLGDPMLRLDAGVPRVTVDRIDNGFLQPGGRLAIRNRLQPLGLRVTLRDEQGLDSLWVVERFAGGANVPIPNVTRIANIDTAAAIVAKRSITVDFQLSIDQCNFDIVIGARDLAGRVTEFVGRLQPEQRLLANGVPITSGERVDPRTAFDFEIQECSPVPGALPLEVRLDGAIVPPELLVIRPDAERVNWQAEFTPPWLAAGTHRLQFVYAGDILATYDVTVGGFGMTEVVAFPNPLRKHDDAMRIFFHLGEPIAGGHLRIMDLNGRTVGREDLSQPGVVKSDVQVPPGAIGSGVGQDDTHWNYVELFRAGLDARGDALANGVYLYELEIRGLSGQTQRRRDRVVIMR